jgi:alpha-L-fucosidase 2
MFFNLFSISISPFTRLFNVRRFSDRQALGSIPAFDRISNWTVSITLTGMIVLGFVGEAAGQVKPVRTDIATLLDACNVTWNTPGPTSAQSMPIGNGDIGLNVWVERNGDLAFYISKTDAWGEGYQEQDPWMKQGGVLMKLGLVKVSLTPSPFSGGSGFSQVLKLHTGEIEVSGGQGTNPTTLRVWIDANHPVIHLESFG